MIKILISDLSRVLLFPVDDTYKQSLNELARSLRTGNPNYNFWDYFRLNEELVDVYRSLHIPMHIFTSDSVQEHPSLKAKLNVFNSVLSAKKLGLSKDDKQAYSFLADTLNALPDEILYLDDNYKNIEAATSAGLQTICFKSNDYAREQINKLINKA